jgi:hypothetical protein
VDPTACLDFDTENIFLPYRDSNPERPAHCLVAISHRLGTGVVYDSFSSISKSEFHRLLSMKFEVCDDAV